MSCADEKLKLCCCKARNKNKVIEEISYLICCADEEFKICSIQLGIRIRYRNFIRY